MSLSNCYANTIGSVRPSDNFIHVKDITVGELAVVYNGLSVHSEPREQFPTWGAKYHLTALTADDVNVLVKDDYVLLPTDSSSSVVENKMMIGRVVSDDTVPNTKVTVDVGDNTYARYLSRQLLFRIDNLSKPNKFYRTVADRYNIEAVVGDIVKVYSEIYWREVLAIYPLSGMVRLSKPLDAEGKEVVGYLNDVYFIKPRKVESGEYAIAAGDYSLIVPNGEVTLDELFTIKGAQASIPVFDIHGTSGNYCLAKNLDTNSTKLYLKEALRPLAEREVVVLPADTK